MENIKKTDLLIVYNSNVAQSANSINPTITTPFNINSAQSNYNIYYGYMMKRCKKNNINAAFTTSSDIIGPGLCNSYWQYNQGQWYKQKQVIQADHIFDKFSPTSKNGIFYRNLLLSDKRIKPFNNQIIFKLFHDKFLTYRKFHQYTIPTVLINQNNIKTALPKLFTHIFSHKNKDDFSKQFIILKDRFGSGGNKVFKINFSDEQTIMNTLKNNQHTQFIAQPFLLFNKGYKFQNKYHSVDIRVILYNSVFFQSYIRIAQQNNFLCNEHQGGKLIYTNSNQVPTKIIAITNSMVKKINQPNSLYALDFLISNNGNPYFIEGNVNPGIDWDINCIKNETMSKQLINTIVLDYKNRLISLHN